MKAGCGAIAASLPSPLTSASAVVPVQGIHDQRVGPLEGGQKQDKINKPKLGLKS